MRQWCARRMLKTCWLAWLLTLLPLTAQAEGPVDFARDVAPLFQRHCVECHGAIRSEGELRLDNRDRALQGGASGNTIVPGDPDASELLRRISLPAGDVEVMPSLGKPLSAADQSILRQWIAQGAEWPLDWTPGEHWAYVAPQRPAVPNVQAAEWVKNPIDAFVLAKLEARAWQPAPREDRAVLLRRLSLDLTGLPPNPSDVAAFVADTRADAYERVVDRLLADPGFGERWARPWLDAARYADSHGFQRDDLRNLWAYRDWVIRAFNADLPFDQFTREQLAGDLLPTPSESQLIATGFNRCPTTNVEAGTDPEENRVNQVLDRVNTMAGVWLGTTLECCQCHDHKYDPFSQKEYYQLFAFFNDTVIEAERANPNVPGSIRFLGPAMPLTDVTWEDATRKRITADLAALDAQLTAHKQRLLTDLDRWAAELVAGTSEESRENVLRPLQAESAEGATATILDDGSVLFSDEVPERDTYTITVNTDLTSVVGFRLEALTDPSLPGEGPGRSDPARPNFVLNEFTVTATDGDGVRRPLVLSNPRASFEQTGLPVEKTIDGDAKSGWAIRPEFSRSHWAVFECQTGETDSGSVTLTFRLEQNFGGGRVLGRVRLSAIQGTMPDLDTAETLIPPEIAKLLAEPAEGRSRRDRDQLAEYRQTRDAQGEALLARRAKLNRELQQLPELETLVMRPADEPRPTAIFNRGVFSNPGERVEAEVPAGLPSLPTGPRNRLTLANWLVDRGQPLTARVVVNRTWAEMFGRGIVATVEDFGVKGEPPTHPELLDWLAVEFMEGTSGFATGEAPQPWSFKHLLKLIVTSATYQQSSHADAGQREADDQNTWLSRGPRLRMDAEMIRDNALAVSGLLSRIQFGPPIRPYQPEGLWTKIGGVKVDYEVSPGEHRHRRGVYVVWKRGALYPSFVNFDATPRLACTLRRSRSNTPLQALTLLNDPVYVEAAQALAQRMMKEAPGSSLADRVQYGFELCVARRPTPAEQQVLVKLWSTEYRLRQAAAGAARQAVPGQAGEEAAAAAAWQAVATVLLNLDETISKP